MNRTCLNRLIGNCPDCQEDYDPEHHPNNLDCQEYRSVNFHTYEVKECQEQTTEKTTK